MTTPSLRAAVQQEIDKAIARLSDLDLSGTARFYGKALLRLMRQSEYQRVLERTETHRRELQSIAGVLEDLHLRVSEIEAARAQDDPLGEEWWNRRRRDLSKATGSAWEQLWICSWTQAFAAEDFELCAKILQLPLQGAAEDLAGELHTAAVAASTGDFVPVARTLSRLLDSYGESVLGSATTVRLAVLVARVHLRDTGDVEAAEAAAAVARQAVQPGPRQPPLPLVAVATAVQGEIALARMDFARAKELFGQAAAIAPEVPDGYIGAGLVAEDESEWYRAEECFDQAINAAGAAAVEVQLLRPVSANLLWRYARTIRESDPARALAVLDEAIARGIRGDGVHPQRAAIVDRARTLATLERPQEAADAFHLAGNMFLATDDNEHALKYFDRARELAPDRSEYHWEFAEALRISASDPDDIVDRDAMWRAWTAVTTGIESAAPGAVVSWALVTAALIADKLPDLDVSPVILSERSLLIDREYARGYAHTAKLLRDRGWPAEAFEAAQQGFGLAKYDVFVVEQYAAALMDHGQYERALQVIEEIQSSRADAHNLLSMRVGTLFVLQHPELAVRAVGSNPTGVPDVDDVLLGLSHLMAGHTRKASRLFERIWQRRDAATARYLLLYATWLTGRFDEAVKIGTDLLPLLPDRAMIDRDLGQLYLHRGLTGDVDRGADQLLGGIEATLVVEALRYLVAVELPLLRRLVADAQHAGAVDEVIEVAAKAANQRIDVLLRRRRPVGGDEARLAYARTCMHSGDPEEATRTYADLVRRDAVPEARYGLAGALRRATALADDLVAADDLDGATRAWQRLGEVAQSLLPGSPEFAAIEARLAFAAQEINHPERAGPHLRTVTELDARPALEDAAKIFVRNVSSYWRHRDALLERADDESIPTAGRDVLAATAHALDLATLCRMRRDDVDPALVFPLLTQVEVCLGRDLARHDSRSRLTDALNGVRARLEDDTGVHVPEIRVSVNRPVEPATAEFCVVEEVVRRAAWTPGDGDLPTWIAGHLDAALRPRLPRLLGVDDVLLWLTGWEQSAGSAYGDIQDRVLVRLRLARLLRLLLKEGVSISDRSAIVAGFSAAERDGVHDPLAALRYVRRSLGRDALAGGGALVPLGADLEARLAEGIRDGNASVWELPRARAEELVGELSRWQDGRNAPDAVVVQDATVRPLASRLFAASGTPLAVVAEEELGEATS